MAGKQNTSDKLKSRDKGQDRREFMLRMAGASAAGAVAATIMPRVVLAQQSAKAGAIVEMNDDLEYVPSKVRIKAGQTVEWRNIQSFPHSVTADTNKVENPNNVELPGGAKPFDSGAIFAGQTFRHTFKKPGVYRYVCIPHEQAGMLGTVIVA